MCPRQIGIHKVEWFIVSCTIFVLYVKHHFSTFHKKKGPLLRYMGRVFDINVSKDFIDMKLGIFLCNYVPKHCSYI